MSERTRTETSPAPWPHTHTHTHTHSPGGTPRSRSWRSHAWTGGCAGPSRTQRGAPPQRRRRCSCWAGARTGCCCPSGFCPARPPRRRPAPAPAPAPHLHPRPSARKAPAPEGSSQTPEHLARLKACLAFRDSGYHALEEQRKCSPARSTRESWTRTYPLSNSPTNSSPTKLF